MSVPFQIPFGISPSAEQRLKQVGEVPGMQPGICLTCRYRIEKNGEVTEEFVGEHYFLAFDVSFVWESVHSAVCVTFVGRRFWLSPDAVDSLKGKVLTQIEREVGRGSCAGTRKGILIAVDPLDGITLK